MSIEDRVEANALQRSAMYLTFYYKTKYIENRIVSLFTHYHWFGCEVSLIRFYIRRIANLPHFDLFRGTVICRINRDENTTVLTAQKQLDSKAIPTEQRDVIGSVQTGFRVKVQNKSTVFNIHRNLRSRSVNSSFYRYIWQDFFQRSCIDSLIFVFKVRGDR